MYTFAIYYKIILAQFKHVIFVTRSCFFLSGCNKSDPHLIRCKRRWLWQKGNLQGSMVDELLCNILRKKFKKKRRNKFEYSLEERFTLVHLYPVRGSEWSGLGGSHGCPGRIWDRFL